MTLACALGRSSIGLDIGSSMVRAVVLRRGVRRWRLVAAREAPIEARPDAAPESGDISSAVRTVLRDVPLRRAPVVGALRGDAAIVKRVSLPAMGARELGALVPWEAEQQLPFALKDARLAYLVLKSSGQPGPTVEVLLVAARRDRIQERVDLVAQAARPPRVLDVEALALVNAYRANYPDRSDRLAALIHVGRRTAIVCLLEDGRPLLARDVAVPGQLGRGAPDAVPQAATQLAREVRETIEFCLAAMPVGRVSRVVLSGGAWRALGDALGASFGAPIDVLDPFRRVAGAVRVLGAGARPAYAVAVGLAMRREGDR